jgi:hypothetical protein
MDGQDLGPLTAQFFGDSDFEYWLTVDKGHKDRLLLLLMREVFANDPRAARRFKEWLKEHDIPYTFESY